MSSTRTAATSTLTGHILHLLLRHQLATTDQLHELLADQANAADLLDDRLEVLHAQGLTARHQGAWHLTQEGLAVARTLPESAGLRPDRPPHARTAMALTALGISFLRQHRRHSAAPRSSGTPRSPTTSATPADTPPRSQSTHGCAPAARLPTDCSSWTPLSPTRPDTAPRTTSTSSCSPWPDSKEAAPLPEAASAGRGGGGTPASHILLAAEPQHGGVHDLLNQVATAARAEPEVAGSAGAGPARAGLTGGSAAARRRGHGVDVTKVSGAKNVDGPAMRWREAGAARRFSGQPSLYRVIWRSAANQRRQHDGPAAQLTAIHGSNELFERDYRLLGKQLRSDHDLFIAEQGAPTR